MFLAFRDITETFRYHMQKEQSALAYGNPAGKTHDNFQKWNVFKKDTSRTPCRLVFKLPEQVLLHATSYVIFLTFSAVGMTSGPTGNRVC